MSSNRRLIKSTALIALFVSIHSQTILANSMEEFYRLYKNGSYAKAISSLEKINASEINTSTLSYLKGLSHSRLQEYDKAIIQFEIAIKEKNESRDLYYEYGQALYASNELKKARDAFKTSASTNFNQSASYYYVAHISQILEEFEISREYYLKVIKDKKSDPKIRQVSHFQLAETLLSIARDKSNTPDDLTRRVEKFILPMLKTAYETDKTTGVAYEINQRIAEVMQEFNLDPDLMNNGRRINPKRFSAYFGQKMKFDDNISLTSEENNVSQTRKESYIFESEVYAKYDFVLKKKFILSPEARINFVEHADRHSPEVYQNDSLSLNFNLKNKYEHKKFDKPASFIFDIDYSNTSRDWKQRKKRDYYSTAVTFTIGESFTYFSFGDTSLKIKRKDYEGDNTAINNNTYTLSADQTVFLPIGHLLIGLFEANFVDNYNNKLSNTNSYLTRFDYLIPAIWPKYTLGLAIATTITDTVRQKASRGTEVSINPSLDLSKEITPAIKVGINYDFTKSKSKDTNYTYRKHVYTGEFRYSF